jgi:two-component system chemotaxis response regulator CheY
VKKTPILVVSAEKAIRSLMRQTLTEAEGFETDFASDAMSALEVLSPRHRMALVDFDMAEMNGLQFLQQVRMGRTAARRNVSIGVLAGFADNAVLTAAIALDLNTMLLKPISSKDILRRVTRVMTDDIQPKAIAEYERVGIPAGDLQRAEAERDGRTLASVLLPGQPLFNGADAVSSTARRPGDVADIGFGPLLRRPITEIGVGWQVGQDIVGPTGTRLVAAGTIISPRLLTRLLELVEEGTLFDAWTRAPLTAPR